MNIRTIKNKTGSNITNEDKINIQSDTFDRRNISHLSNIETDNLEIDYIFNMKNDVKSIINSSDELKKSEAISEAISLLLVKLTNLEKIKLEQIYAYQNLKIEYDNMYKNFEELKRENSLISDQNKFLLNEISELKSFIEKNESKIIKYDMIDLECKNLDSINKK